MGWDEMGRDGGRRPPHREGTSRGAAGRVPLGRARSRRGAPGAAARWAWESLPGAASPGAGLNPAGGPELSAVPSRREAAAGARCRPVPCALRGRAPSPAPCSRRGFVLAPAPGPPCVPPCCSPLCLGKSLCAIMGSTQESRLENRSEGCLAKTHRSRGVRHRSSWEKVALAFFSVALPLGSRRTFGRVSGSQTPPLGIAKLLGKFFVCNNCRQRERGEQNAPRRACSFPSE